MSKDNDKNKKTKTEKSSQTKDDVHDWASGKTLRISRKSFRISGKSNLIV